MLLMRTQSSCYNLHPICSSAAQDPPHKSDDGSAAGRHAGGHNVPDNGGRPPHHLPLGTEREGGLQQRGPRHRHKAHRRVRLLVNYRSGDFLAQRKLHLRRRQRGRIGEVRRSSHR